jgi:hypothetical protein
LALGAEVPKEPFSRRHVNRKPPTGTEASRVAVNDIKVFRIAEKSEAALPVESRIKLFRKGHRAHVSDDEVAVKPFPPEPIPGSLDE